MWTSFSVVVALAAQLVPAGPFKEVGRDGDIVIEARPIQGTAFEEIRVSAEVAAPVDVALGLMWGEGTPQERSPSVTVREVLQNDADTRIYYEVAAAPLVSPRDYVLQVTRHPAEHALRFTTINDARRPPKDGTVRIPRILGSSVATAVGDGTRSRVVHTVFSETGGNVPAWIARGGQRDNMVAFIKTLRAKLSARSAPRP